MYMHIYCILSADTMIFLESNENDIADKDVGNFDESVLCISNIIVKLKAGVDKMQYICIYI
jgi:hypothetical protein